MTTLVNACASTKDYAKFGQTGQAYAQAINKLLDATKKVSIDSSSEKMLVNRPNTREERKILYTNTNTNDTEWLDLLSQMQAHTNLLAKYFERLQALATSDAPDRAQAETENIVENLSMIGDKIRSNGLVNGKVIPQIVDIAVKARIRSSLKAELKARKATIQKKLDTQDKVLALITQELNRQLKDLQEIREERLLYKPYVTSSQINNPDDFVNNRGHILALTTMIPELEQATKVSGELKSSFLDLIDGKLTPNRVNVLLSDIDSLLQVAQNLKG